MPRPLLAFQYGILTLLAIVIAAGTAATGAGPLAGNAQGQEVAKRIPLAFRDLAELHAVLAMLLVGVTVGLVVGLHVADVPERVRRAGRMLLGGHGGPGRRGLHAVLHAPPRLLVEVHILGATVLVVGAVHCFLACTFHPPEQVPVPAAEPRTGAGLPIGAR